MSPSFLEIPDLPMEMIMNNLDFFAIQSVRKTCWDLRNFIDDKKPGMGIELISIIQRDTTVNLTIFDTIPENLTITNINYEKHENACKICVTYNGHKNKIVQNLNFLDAVFHDIKVALNSQKSTIKKVFVDGDTFFEKIEESMKSQKPFATESIEIRGRCLEHVRQIMRCADPKYLKSIEYSKAAIKIYETVNLESSKNIQNLSHFITASIQLENLDVETLRAIKENFLQFHEYDKDLVVHNIIENLFIDAFGAASESLGEIWKIWYFNVPDNKEKVLKNFLQFHEYDKDLFVHNPIRENLFIDAFGEAFETLEENEENWFFNVPGNKEKVLKVHNQYLVYKFQFLEKCKVPEGYVILD